MTWLNDILILLDTFLIFPFRLPDNPIFGFFLGTLMLCLMSSIIGGYLGLMFSFLNKNHSRRLKDETVSMHNLSIKAIVAGDKASYTGCNKLANEAFGRYFFSQFGEGAAMLLPVVFAVAWMQIRFQDVSFSLPVYVPGLGQSVGFLFIFILIYILSRMVVRHVQHRLPFVEKLNRAIRSSDSTETMIGFPDIPGKPIDSQPVHPFVPAPARTNPT
ncbi:MAG: hypothetical protein AB7S77_14825 [Desulfatirhabdiaceae bacterium]